MIYYYILIGSVIIALLLASYFDLKTRIIPPIISYGLIVFGLLFRTFASLFYKDKWIILFGIVGFSIMFFLTLIIYNIGGIGGGDCKLLRGIGTCLIGIPSSLGIDLFFLSLEIIFFVGIFYILFYKLINKKEKDIPFAPGIFMGMLITLIFL